MAYKLNIPYGYEYYFFVRENEDGTKDGSLGYEERPGMAYCVAKQPRYGDDEEWKSFCELWIDAIETYKKTGKKPSELLEVIDTVNSLANKALDKIDKK